MKYQLIGWKKVLKVSPVRKAVEYPSGHICLLPYEILVEIFRYFSHRIKTLLALAQTCSRFQVIVNKNFLYKSVLFNCTESFSKFALCHLPIQSTLAKKLRLPNEASSKINYISTVRFTNPPTKDSINYSTKIAGAYDVESVQRRDDQLGYQEYVQQFLVLLSEAYGIKEITVDEMSPSFYFCRELLPPDPKLWQKTNRRRTLAKLTLRAQSGWSIPFKLDHLSMFLVYFDTISELVLSNFIIDDHKLTVLMDLKQNTSIPKVTLVSCTFHNTLRKLNLAKTPSKLFLETTVLQLKDILTGGDLSIIDFIKQNQKLSKLILDFDSAVFYHATDKSFNFSRFNMFFKLLCSGHGGFSTLKELVLVNFDLFEYFKHFHKQEVDTWVEPPTDTFEALLTFLSNIPSLTLVLKKKRKSFKTCKNCGFTESLHDKDLATLNDNEWSIILRPLLTTNETCTITVLDHRFNVIFQREND